MINIMGNPLSYLVFPAILLHVQTSDVIAYFGRQMSTRALLMKNYQ